MIPDGTWPTLAAVLPRRRPTAALDGAYAAIVGYEQITASFPRNWGSRRFALSLPISSLMCGITSRENLRQDLAMARNFQPITGRDLEELLAKTADRARDGKLEPHKTTRFGSAHHFRQHGK